jgi:hypothetical protein
MKHEALRAIDQVDPPDQWQDILHRAKDGDGQRSSGGAPSRRHRAALSLLATAAVILVVIAAIVVINRDDRVRRPTKTGSTTAPRPDTPAAIIGRSYRVGQLTDAGVDLPLAGLAPPTFTFDGTKVNINGCNGAGGPAHLDGARLMTASGFHTARGCEQALMDQDGWFQSFLEAGPTVTVSGANAVLEAGDRHVTLHDFGGAVPPTPLVGKFPTPSNFPDRPGFAPSTIVPLGAPQFTLTDGGPGDGPCLTIEPGSPCSANGAPVRDGDLFAAHTGKYESGGWEYAVLYGYLPPDATRANALLIAGGPTIPTINHDGMWAAVLGSGGNGIPGSKGESSFAATVDYEHDPTAAPPPTTAVRSAPGDDPTSIIGPTWEVTSILQDGSPRSLFGQTRQSFIVTASRASFHGCDEVWAFSTVKGNRLVTKDGISKELRCAGARDGSQDHAVRSQRDLGDWLAKFLAADPLIEVHGDDATLTSGGSVIHLARFAAELPVAGTVAGLPFQLSANPNGFLCVRIGDRPISCNRLDDLGPTQARAVTAPLPDGTQSAWVTYAYLPEPGTQVWVEFPDGHAEPAAPIMGGGAWAIPLPAQAGVASSLSGFRIRYVRSDGFVSGEVVVPEAVPPGG